MQVETLAWGMGKPAQMVASPSACRGQRSRCVGKGVVMAALPLTHYSAMMPCFYGGAPYSCPFRLSFHSQQLSPAWVHAPNPTFQQQAPSPQQETHASGWGAQSCGADHACSFYFVLPSTDHLLHSPLISRRSLSVPADFPTMRGFFWVRGPPLTFSFPPNLLVSFLIPPFFFSFFYPTWLWGDFSCPFRRLNSSANVQQVLWENCSICRWFLMYLWGVTNSLSSYSATFTPPPQSRTLNPGLKDSSTSTLHPFHPGPSFPLRIRKFK